MLSVEQIATRLCISEETVRRWIRNGQLKTSINSRREGHMILDEDFEEFLANHPKYINRMQHIAEVAGVTEKHETKEAKHENQISAKLDTLIRAIVRDELQKILKSGMGL